MSYGISNAPPPTGTPPPPPLLEPEERTRGAFTFSTTRQVLSLTLFAVVVITTIICIRRHRGRRRLERAAAAVRVATRSQAEHAVEESIATALSSLPKHYWNETQPRKPGEAKKRSERSERSERSDGRRNQDGKGEAEECTLCLQSYCTGEQVTTLPCTHFYHSECIAKWFDSRKFAERTCPLCKCSPLDFSLQLDAVTASSNATETGDTATSDSTPLSPGSTENAHGPSDASHHAVSTHAPANEMGSPTEVSQHSPETSDPSPPYSEKLASGASASVSTVASHVQGDEAV